MKRFKLIILIVAVLALFASIVQLTGLFVKGSRAPSNEPIEPMTTPFHTTDSHGLLYYTEGGIDFGHIDLTDEDIQNEYYDKINDTRK